jgi:hypothetical protein
LGRDRVQQDRQVVGNLFDRFRELVDLLLLSAKSDEQRPDEWPQEPLG